MDEMRQGLAACRATGATVTLPSSLASLAEACVRVGRPEEALGLLDEAVEVMDQSGERHWEAELYRLKGTALHRTGDEIEAEACFQRAVDTARRQQARSWELRATISLCRLWYGQNRRAKARLALQQIYGWFTEGYDTPDLREAKAFLDR